MDKITETAVAGLEKASQKHEEHIVIDFGLDRLIMFVGSYVFGALTVLSIVVVIIGPVLTCDPPNGSNSVAVAEFTRTFCWGSSKDNNTACKQLLPIEDSTLRDDHTDIKFLYQWLPYLLAQQFVMFIAPWVYWHFAMGARLNGQLKYMRVLLKEIFERLKVIKKGLYDDKPYDKNSTTFNGSEKYEEILPPECTQRDDGSWSRTRKRRTARAADQTNEMRKDTAETIFNKTVEAYKFSTESLTKRKSGMKNSWKRVKHFITGDLQDRHLFSMFCYENFSSLEYLPYIISVFQLSKMVGGTHGEDPDINYYDMNEGILYQWCHRHNFTNNFLTIRYLAKHLFVAFVAFANLLVVGWMATIVDISISSSTNYRCYLPRNEICVLCAINGRREALIIFYVDAALIAMILIASLYHWYSMKSNINQASCHYFEQMKETCSVAFLAAGRMDAKYEETENMKLELMHLLKQVLYGLKDSQLKVHFSPQTE